MRYALPRAAQVSLRIYDSGGRLQSILVKREQHAGYYAVDVSRHVSAAGTYLLELKAGDFNRKRVVVLMR